MRNRCKIFYYIILNIFKFLIYKRKVRTLKKSIKIIELNLDVTAKNKIFFKITKIKLS